MPVTVSLPKIRRRRWKSPSGELKSAWQLDFTIVHPSGQRTRHRHSFPRREDAEGFFERAKAEALGQVSRDAMTVRACPSLGEFVESFHAEGSAHKKPRSIVQDRLATSHFLRQFGATLRLDQIKPQHFDEYLAVRMAAGRKPRTIARELATLGRMMRLAIRWGHLTEDPSTGVRKPRAAEGEVVFLEVADQLRLLDAAARRDANARHNSWSDAPYLRPMITLALHSGLRRSELFNLRWEQIDFKRREIRVRNSKQFETKSGKARSLAITDDVASELHEWQSWFLEEIERAQSRAADEKLPAKLRLDAEKRLRTLRAREPRPERLVFPSFRVNGSSDESGAAVLNNINKSWKALLLDAFGVEEPTPSKCLPPRAGKDRVGKPGPKRRPLPPRRVLPARYDIGLHALRHTFAVMLARAAVPLAKIKAAMGHASIRTTEIYLRFSPDEGRDVTSRLPALRGTSGTNPAHAERFPKGEARGD